MTRAGNRTEDDCVPGPSTIKEPIPLLLVDDEPDFLDSVAQRLELRGFRPRTAATGEECLKYMDEVPVPVVVLDVRLPGMNGLEILRRLKSSHPETEVVLITGHANTRDGVQGMKDGAFDYLAKPVDIDHLARKIHQARDTVLRRMERRREAIFREQMEQRMAEAQRLASLGTLAMGIAHEINNPVGIMVENAGWIEDLLADIPCNDIDREELDQAIKKIRTQGQRCKEITHKLLHFARKSDSRLQVMDVNEVVHDVVLLMNKSLHCEKVVLKTHLAEELPEINASPPEIRQVLVNLINNAVYALQDLGGSITIFTKSAQHHEIGESVLLEVSDNGPGISEEDLAHIFEPFFTTKPVGQGTGLGLSICYGIVKNLDGEIQVESSPGRGSTFRIYLPAHSQSG